MKDKNSVGILLMLLGILAFVLVWQFVYIDYETRTEQLESQRKSLQEQVDQLQNEAANGAVYEEKIQDMKVDMATLLKRFAVYYLPDDMIALLYHADQVSDNTLTVSASYGEPQLLYVSGSTSSLSGYQLYDYPVTVETRNSYQGMKDVITYLYQDLRLRNINSIDASVDEEGFVKLVVEFDNFFMVGSDGVYETPEFDQKNFSKGNVFGSYNHKKKQAESESKEETESKEEAEQ